MKWEDILLSIVAALVPIITGLIAWLVKRYQNYKKKHDLLEIRSQRQQELLNYTYGIIDLLLKLKYQPKQEWDKTKESLKNGSERYHRMDLDKQDQNRSKT